jgi:hypothetical protein
MFKLNLSAELRQSIEAERAELKRLYGLTSQWLAHALLKLARQAQAATPQYSPHEAPTYNSRLIWGIVPELARRLGTVKLTLEEIDWEIRELSDYELRLRIGYTLANVGHETLPGWSLLSAEVVNGNPVVFGIDRLCPGKVEDRDDPVVRRSLEICRYRGCAYTGVWTPDFLKD